MNHTEEWEIPRKNYMKKEEGLPSGRWIGESISVAQMA